MTCRNRCRTPTSSPPTRTPVGKAPRGVFRTTRPGLAARARAAAACWRRCRRSIPARDRRRDRRLRDARSRAGDERRAHRRAAGGLAEHASPGMTINRFCSSGLQRGVDRRRPHPHRRGRRHDRRRHREHEHDPDDGPARAQRSTCSRATRTSASPTAWASPRRRSPSSWKVSREDAGRVRARVATGRRSRRRRRASSTTRSRPIRSTRTCPISRPDKIVDAEARARSRRGPARRHQRRGAREAAAGVRGEGLGDRRQQLADVRRRRRGDRS